MDASKAFDKVLLEQVSFSIINTKNKQNLIDIGTLDQKKDEIVHFGKFSLMNIFTPDFKNAQIYKGVYPKLIDKIQKKSISDLGNLVKAEMGLSNVTAYFTLESKGTYPCVKGFDIIRYGLKKEKRYLPKKIAERYLSYYCKNKIVAQKIIAHVQNPFPHIIITMFFDDSNRLISDTCVEIKSLDYRLRRKIPFGLSSIVIYMLVRIQHSI